MVTAEQQRQYREQGYVVVPDLITDAELAGIRAMVERLIDGELKPELTYNGNVAEDFAITWEVGLEERNDLPRRDRIRNVSWMCLHHPYFLWLGGHPAIYEVAAGLFGTGIQIFSDTVFIKPAHHGSEIPPHQDSAFWAKLDPPAMNFWMALDPATAENGCLMVIPGSHTVDLPHHPGPTVSKMLREDQADFSRQIPIELEPGGVLFFHSGLIHRSYPNRSDRSRLSYTSIYMADNVRHVEPWNHQERLIPLPRPGVAPGA
jgi:ectoine hydroxylase-related dioxygenase (phytanoyl-CoA dioxygenase family)